jgi:SRSO17 transposase
MDVHASPDELPELKEFLGSFQVRFRRPEGADALERYTTGLLTELPNKHCDTIAQAVPGTSEQRLQEFLTNMPWDEEDLNRQRVDKLIAEATLGDGVLGLDDTGFPKQGTASAGVARQYSGTLGKVGNCQVAVTCCDTAPQASWPVAVRLYLPQTWADDPNRRRKARVPSEVTFQTKPEIALALLDRARAWGVTRDERRHIGWLVGERATRGQPEERKYYWSNLPAAATLEELAGYAHRRYAVEQFHEEAKGERGWDQYQGRLWPGFHRHAVTAMLAYSFLVWLELRQRRGPRGRGRPRDPFSPSPGPTAADATGDPSGGRPVATPPSAPVVGDNRSIYGTLLTKVLTKQY